METLWFGCFGYFLKYNEEVQNISDLNRSKSHMLLWRSLFEHKQLSCFCFLLLHRRCRFTLWMSFIEWQLAKHSWTEHSVFGMFQVSNDSLLNLKQFILVILVARNNNIRMNDDLSPKSAKSSRIIWPLEIWVVLFPLRSWDINKIVFDYNYRSIHLLSMLCTLHYCTTYVCQPIDRMRQVQFTSTW